MALHGPPHFNGAYHLTLTAHGAEKLGGGRVAQFFGRLRPQKRHAHCMAHSGPGWPRIGFFPQQRKLMGSSAQISSGVCRRGSQEQVPEEGSGRFRRVPACAGVGSGGRFRKVPESSGVCWCRFRRQVPEGSGEFRCKMV